MLNLVPNKYRDFILGNELFLLTIVVLFPIFFPSYIEYGIVAIMLLLPIILFKKDFLQVLIIICFLSLTGSSFEKYRDIINILLVLLLLFIYIKQFGIQFVLSSIPASALYFIILYFITLLISTAFSSSFIISGYAIARSIIYFFICYLLYSLINGKKTINIYVLSLAVALIIIGFTVIYEIFSSGLTALIFEGTIARYSGIYGNPNYVGMLIVIMLPLTIIYFKVFSNNKKVKIILSFFLVFQFMVLAISNSRASILGSFIASVFVLGILYRNILKRIILPLILLSVIIILFVPAVNEFLELYLRLDRISSRSVFWQAGIDVIKDYPFTGIGPDMFDQHFFNYMPSFVNDIYKSGLWIVGKPHPHNFFLFYAAENGILGVVVSVSFFVLFFYYAINAALLNINKNQEFYYYSIGMIGIGIGMLIRSFYEVTGLLTYGYITRDLPFGVVFTIVLFLYSKSHTNNTESTQLKLSSL